MIFSSIRKGELKEIFDSLEEAFNATGVDYYIIGALAKNIWYAKGDLQSTQTKDVDFAILVGSQEHYNTVKNHLKEKKNFVDTKSNSFVMLSPSGAQVDILPFGEAEMDGSIAVVKGDFRLNGLMEVYTSGTNELELETGHHFNIDTLPSIILIKLIAYDDRPEVRMKDARDIAEIIYHFFEIQPTVVYDQQHLDLFKEGAGKVSLPEISAIIIGREIKKIISSNRLLKKRVVKILNNRIDQWETESFLKNMIAGTGQTVEKVLTQLNNILLGLTE